MLLRTTFWILCQLSQVGLLSLNAQSMCDRTCGPVVKLSPALGSSTILPCGVKAHESAATPMSVAWTREPLASLVRIGPSGNVSFTDNRNGRLKVFPYLSSVGNFSVRVDRLQLSDLGVYCCAVEAGTDCSQVVFLTHPGSEDVWSWHIEDSWYILAAVGAAAFFLITACVVYVKFRCRKKTDAEHANSYGDNPPQEMECNQQSEVSRGPDNPPKDRECNQQSEVSRGPDNPPKDRECNQQKEVSRLPGNRTDAALTIYENNEHDPSVQGGVQCPRCYQQGVTCGCGRQQQNVGRPYYANQSEIRKQAKDRIQNQNKRSFWRRQPKQAFQCRNPIYSDSNQ